MSFVSCTLPETTIEKMLQAVQNRSSARVYLIGNPGSDLNQLQSNVWIQPVPMPHFVLGLDSQSADVQSFVTASQERGIDLRLIDAPLNTVLSHRSELSLKGSRVLIPFNLQWLFAVMKLSDLGWNWLAQSASANGSDLHPASQLKRIFQYNLTPNSVEAITEAVQQVFNNCEGAFLAQAKILQIAKTQ